MATDNGDAALQLLRAGASVTLHPALLLLGSDQQSCFRATQLLKGRGAVYLAAERGLIAVFRFLCDEPRLRPLLTASCLPEQPSATPLTVAATFGQWRCCAALARMPPVRATLRRDAGAFLRAALLVVDRSVDPGISPRLLPLRVALCLRPFLSVDSIVGVDSMAMSAQLRRSITALMLSQPQGDAQTVGNVGDEDDEEDSGGEDGWTEACEEALVALLNADDGDVDVDSENDMRVRSSSRRQWLHRDSGLLSHLLQRIVQLRQGSDRALELLSQAVCGVEGCRRSLACHSLWPRGSAGGAVLLRVLGAASAPDASVSETWCRSATAQLLLFDNAAALSVLLLGGGRSDWTSADVDVLRRLATAVGAHRCSTVLEHSGWTVATRAEL